MSEDSSRSLLRFAVPLLILVIGGGVAWISLSKSRPTAAPSTTTPAASTPAPSAAPAPSPAPADAPASTPYTPSLSTPPASSTPPPAFRVRVVDAAALSPLGDLTPKDKGGSFELQLEFLHIGAGLKSAVLANHFTTIQRSTPDTVQQFTPLPNNPDVGLAPFAADALIVDGQPLSLWLAPAPGKSFWSQTAPGAFEAVIESADATPIFKITRTYELPKNSFEFTIRQSISNLSSSKHSIRFAQFGPKEFPLPQTRYGGDVRRARFGYLLPLNEDPNQIVLSADTKSTLIPHSTLVGSPTSLDPYSQLPRWDAKQVWPTEESTKRNWSIAWAATTTRYFAAAIHSVKSDTGRKTLSIAERVDRLAIPAPDQNAPASQQVGAIAALRFTSPAIDLAPGAAADLSISAYAGPLSRDYARTQPGALWAGLDALTIFTFGGPCAFCTFQPVAEFLRWFLGLLHNFVFHDWALSIMFLVVCVRSLLHPVTRWSQINMFRFGKHMGRLGPKMNAIKEKYASDPIKMREESARLMREEHVSYASGAMGCIPMFLQMPVWVALYAMLFFTFELRHEHAFYGVVQSLTNHKWPFLADLSEPDHFIPFGTSFNVPLISGMMGPIEAFNILPIVMGVVFFIQQKYLQPPQTTQLSPEMEQQQKIMKVMTVVMFPLFMYNAPSGLALYFLTNSTLGILESKWIRAHAEKLIEKEDAARATRVASGVGTSMWDRIQKRTDKDKKPLGFLARLQKMAEDAQKLQEQKRSSERKKR